MGNASSFQQPEQADHWWPPSADAEPDAQDDDSDRDDDEETRRRSREDKMESFRAELERKRTARREILAERNKEMSFLREQLQKKIDENEALKESIGAQEPPERACRCVELRVELAKTHEDLQAANSQVTGFEDERREYREHVAAMKEVVQVSKHMLEIREGQLRELKSKVTEIESSLAERESDMLSTNLRSEYEKQLRNIRALKTLYEQRQAAARAERVQLAAQLTDVTADLQKERSANAELQERTAELEKNVSDKYDAVTSLQSQLGLAKAEGRGLHQELAVINQLFSQIMGGVNGCRELDLDRLVGLLEENHGLLKDIVVNEESESSSAALPKVLLDLVNRANGTDEAVAPQTESSSSGYQTMNSAAEIVDKLPKVWRVLSELLSQQQQQPHVIVEDTGGIDPCYKSVETPKGPKLVLSVSQTFIRLKDLILEKRSLEKEMTRLKRLNTHLEVRLQDQEKRLEAVSTELSKTWHVVGKMQKQHEQLHTHEKILRYELAQKRKLLTELKQELEYCREKWEAAREKNSSTEEEWKKLRDEFAARKTALTDDMNSGESGYSDERECSSDDESNRSTGHVSEEENETNSPVSMAGTTAEASESPPDVTTQVQEQTELGPADAKEADVPAQNETTESCPRDGPSTSTETHQDLLSRREARLKRLEEQCQQLVRKVTNTSNRSVQICTRLETLHEQYGGENSRSRDADNGDNSQRELVPDNAQ